MKIGAQWLPAVFLVLLLSALACRVRPQGSTALTEPTTAAPVPLATTTALPTPSDSTPSDPIVAVPTLAGDAGKDVDRAFCEGPEIHPIGTSIAEAYEITYEEVLALYCEGHPFDEVLLALETEAQSAANAADILEMRDAGLSWDRIWRELDLIE